MTLHARRALLATLGALLSGCSGTGAGGSGGTGADVPGDPAREVALDLAADSPGDDGAMGGETDHPPYPGPDNGLEVVDLDAPDGTPDTTGDGPGPDQGVDVPPVASAGCIHCHTDATLLKQLIPEEPPDPEAGGGG